MSYGKDLLFRKEALSKVLNKSENPGAGGFEVIISEMYLLEQVCMPNNPWLIGTTRPDFKAVLGKCCRYICH